MTLGETAPIGGDLQLPDRAAVETSDALMWATIDAFVEGTFGTNGSSGRPETAE